MHDATNPTNQPNHKHMHQLTDWNDLQQLINTTSESADIDFKEAVEPSDPSFEIELAKDIAALANTVGGNIIIGASTDLKRTRCTGFHGIDLSIIENVGPQFELAAKQRCRPSPSIAVFPIEIPNRQPPKAILIVRVLPSPVAPIGFSLRQDKGGFLVNKGWAFPYRIGSQTDYLSPDQFGAFESMRARRAAALLTSIPSNERESIQIDWSIGTPQATTERSHHNCRADLKEISLTNNVCLFELRDEQPTMIAIPLDDITTAWREPGRNGVWRVAVRGCIRSKSLGKPREYHPGI